MSQQKQKDLKYCFRCQQLKKYNDFYKSYNEEVHPDGHVPLCKSCMVELVDVNDVETLKNMLRQVDKPFIPHLWESAQKANSPIGEYFKLINAKDFRHLTWKDSDSYSEKNDEDVEFIEEIEEDSFQVTPEIIKKFGKGYTKEEYEQMERFYQDMMASHNINTPAHKKLLIIMCQLQTKMDRALEEDNITLFEKLHKQYQHLITNSGFRPIDKTAADDAAGIKTFSQIFAEVERDGFIKPAPIEVNQDIVDRTIMYLLNYQLKLLNMQTLTEPPPDTPKVDDRNE